jgi:hypothetical protein
VAPDVRDAAQLGRAIGERRQRGDHRGELADLGQVRDDAAQRPGAADGQAALVLADLGAEVGEQLAEPADRLPAVARPAGQGDRAARDHRRREEGRGAGQVRLDAPAAAAQRAGLDGPDVGDALVDDGTGRPQHVDGHAEVGRGRHGRSLVPQH